MNKISKLTQMAWETAFFSKISVHASITTEEAHKPIILTKIRIGLKGGCKKRNGNTECNGHAHQLRHDSQRSCRRPYREILAQNSEDFPWTFQVMAEDH